MDIEKEIEHLMNAMNDQMKLCQDMITDSLDKGQVLYCYGKIDAYKNAICQLDLLLKDYRKSKITE